MPRADVGNESTSTTGGKKGEFKVRYAHIADETMKPKSPDSWFRESLRVVFDVVGTQGETVSLGVTIEDPANDLWGFVDYPSQAPTNDEAALRQFVETNVVREPVEVYVNEFIRSRLATEGEHTFERIIGIWRYQNNEGAQRLGMTAVTADGRTTTWSCKEPQLEKVKGERGPDNDYIGPKGQLNPNQYAFQYLTAFGLKWENLERELQEAEAYWPGHVDANDMPIPSLFHDIENPWSDFLEMIEHHGTGNPVRIEVVRHKQYGLGPKRTGQFPIVKMVPVIRESGVGVPVDAEFTREATVFMEMYDNLTKIVFGKDDARFMIGGKFTDDGRTLAVGVLVPLIHAYPDAVKQQKPDGSPRIDLPPEPTGWTMNGLVCVNLTAERLMKLTEAERFELGLHESGLSHPSTPQNVVEWAAGAVPEWAGAGDDGDGGESL